MKRLEPARSRAEIPTASMADIAFLLIVFFMLTAVFSATRGLEVHLPADERVAPEPAPAVLIRVFADRVEVDCRAMLREAIPAYLAPILERDPRRPVVLYPSADAAYREVVAVYDLLAGTERPRLSDSAALAHVWVPTRSEIAAYVDAFGFDPLAVRCR